MSTTIDSSYNSLLAHIGEALEYGRKKAVSRINESIVETYWTIGKYIVDFEQAGNEKAEYGSETLKRLSKDLIIRYGNGFGLSNVYRMRQLDRFISRNVNRKTGVYANSGDRCRACCFKDLP